MPLSSVPSATETMRATTGRKRASSTIPPTRRRGSPPRAGRTRAERVGVPARARMRGHGGGDRRRACRAAKAGQRIDEVVVVDADSTDGTASRRRARRGGRLAGGRADALLRVGARQGRAMWRALSVLGGQLVCFLDADTERFSAHYATGLLGRSYASRGVVREASTAGRSSRAASLRRREAGA